MRLSRLSDRLGTHPRAARRRWCNALRTAALTILVGICPVVMAVENVSTTRLAVIGEIVPGACSIDLAKGGKVNYGVIALSAIPVEAPLHLDEQQIAFTIRCDDPMTIHLSARDMKPQTAVRSLLPGKELYAFGLGSVNDVNIGQYQLRVISEDIGAQDAQRKVVPVDLIYKYFNHDRWGKVDIAPVWADGSSRLSFAAPGKRTAGVYRLISGVIGVKAIINKRDDLPVGRVPLDGLASLDIYYQ